MSMPTGTPSTLTDNGSDAHEQSDTVMWSNVGLGGTGATLARMAAATIVQVLQRIGVMPSL